ALFPGVSERRVDLDGRFALPAGERRSEPDRPGMLLQGDRNPTDRAEGSSYRLAAGGNLRALDFHGFRRGPERSHEDCRARDGEFPGGTEDGANVAGRSLFTHF